MTANDSNGRTGFNATSLLLMFAGGALTGAAVAYLGQARNRAAVLELAQRTGQKAGHIPNALREASTAAKEAFTAAYDGNGVPVEVQHKL